MKASLPTPPRSIAHRLRLFASTCLIAVVSGQSLPYLFENDASGRPVRIYWQTEPGVRYDLLKSDNLDTWQRVTGYPAMAEGLAMEHSFTPGPGGKGFFKMIPIDEQPPAVVAQYPAVDGFAVGRFADLSIELSDATGIDPASIQFTVGALGTFTHAAPGLTFTDNTVTFDSGGDTALGPWGTTISATLMVADMLGNTLTHTWSFRLEPEPQVAGNVFVFGSPTAQRAGQKVSGPAAQLATRFPAPGGPQKADDPPAWSIEEVLADRIIITYEAGGAPAFTAAQLICNLVPTRENEIFYRRVLSTSDDAPNLRLTVMTEDAELTDFVLQGAVAVSDDSVIYGLDGDGNLVRAMSIDGTRTFPRVGCDLSGSSIKLRPGGGFEATLADLGTYSSGSGLTWLDLSVPEYSWWFTPRLRAGMELDLGGLKAFEAIASGQVSQAARFDADVLLVGTSTKTTLYELPEHLEPKHVVLLGVIPLPVPPFGIPVFATLGFDFSLESKAEAKALLEFEAFYRQETQVNFGASYKRGAGLDWIHSFQATSPDLGGSADLTGEFSLSLTLDPRLEFLVYGLAGVKAAIEPSLGIVATASTNDGFDGQVEGDLDFVLGTAGPAFEKIGFDTSLSLKIWEGEWPLGTQEIAFTTHPQSRVVSPGADVSFTCTLDAPSTPDAPPTPSFQWFHNGTPIPGQTSRSLFLPRVNSGHSGTYFVRATVKQTWPLEDLTADSNPASLAVQSTPAGMALIPGGSFTMGRTSGDTASNAPPVTVTVSAFYMGKHEVTKALWDEVRTWGVANGYTDLRAGGGKASNHPVHTIDWFDMVKWCNARSQKDGLPPVYTVSGAVMKTGTTAPIANWSANGYRLPTEAEWEKAARGGVSGKRFPWGTDTISHSQANYYSSSIYAYDVSPTRNYHPSYTGGSSPDSSPVGSFAPNGYGLYDMAGNMWEWCFDWYGGASTYVNGASDPKGPASGTTRVVRGGSWYGNANNCRAAYRGDYGPRASYSYFGFRIARSSVP